MKWSIFIVNILIHVGTMALFLTIFFFTIAQYFEKKIIQDQIDFVIDDFVGNTLKPVPENTKKFIREKINNSFDKQDLSKADESVRKENNKITKKAWIFVGVLLGIILVIVLMFGFIYKWEKYYLKFLFNSALISLIFVAITETLFMFLIAQNYLSADPNQIKLKIIQTLDKNRCNPCKRKDCIGKSIASCPEP
tara:strand:- start:3960 stop:4541 length:582 start_codon:yes stop_codon:yes gene_type:complete